MVCWRGFIPAFFCLLLCCLGFFGEGSKFFFE